MFNSIKNALVDIFLQKFASIAAKPLMKACRTSFAGPALKRWNPMRTLSARIAVSLCRPEPLKTRYLCGVRTAGMNPILGLRQGFWTLWRPVADNPSWVQV